MQQASSTAATGHSHLPAMARLEAQTQALVNVQPATEMAFESELSI